MTAYHELYPTATRSTMTPTDPTATLHHRAGQVRPKPTDDTAYRERRRARLEEMLRFHPHALLDGPAGNSGAPGDRLLLHSPLYRDPDTGRINKHWAELERCLTQMRTERNWQRKHMLAYYQAPTRITNIPLPVQKLGRNRIPMYDNQGNPIWARDSRGHIVTTPQPKAMPIVPSWVSETEAHQGLAWLEQHYALEPFLPAELAA